jgi:hypothetical protein
VIDPATKRVTHLVVRAQGEPWVERLVSVELADPGDTAVRAVTLRSTAEEIRSLPPVQEVAYPQLGDFPPKDPDWDVGIQEVYALPHHPGYDLQPAPLDFPVLYDRIPKGEVEIRRESGVYSAEGHHLGPLDGFLVDHDERITHLVLERGHLQRRCEVTIPIHAVAWVETDSVTLTLTKDQVESLPEVAVSRGARPPSTLKRGSGRVRRGSRVAAPDDMVQPTTRVKGGANGWDGKRGRRRVL